MMILKSKVAKPMGKMTFIVENIDFHVNLVSGVITFHMYEIRKWVSISGTYYLKWIGFVELKEDSWYALDLYSIIQS